MLESTPPRQLGQEVLARLKEEKEKNPELTEIVDLHHDLLLAQMRVQAPDVCPKYSSEDVLERFRLATPVLRPEDLRVDWTAFSDLYEKVCRIVARHRPDLAPDFGRLLTLSTENPEDLQTALTGYLETGWLEQREDDDQTELLEFVLNHTMRPFLQAYAAALGPLIEPELWQQGRCPICGGNPDLAVLEEESGARHLVCSRCDCQWVYPRVKCPFCSTTEPSNLSYYPSADERYRLYVCRGCKRYLKTVDLRKARRRVLIPVERVATVAMDIAARQEGYR